MQNMGLLMEYEDILLKKRKDFSATYIGQNASQKDIKELFQYVFENLLEWTPNGQRLSYDGYHSKATFDEAIKEIGISARD